VHFIWIAANLNLFSVAGASVFVLEEVMEAMERLERRESLKSDLGRCRASFAPLWLDWREVAFLADLETILASMNRSRSCQLWGGRPHRAE
jgi:hypothetical protein